MPGRKTLEPLTGVEPAPSAWKAEVLPINYSGVFPAGHGLTRRAVARIAVFPAAIGKEIVLALVQRMRLEGVAGIDPAFLRLCSASGCPHPALP